MFNEGILQFIQQMQGSRQRAAHAMGCTTDMLGKMLRGDEAVPLQRALHIEILSKGTITADQLIKYTRPDLSKDFKEIRHLHYRQVVKQHSACFLVDLSVQAITTGKFTFCDRDYLIENGEPVLIVDTSEALLYGLTTLSAARAHNQQSIRVWCLDVQALLQQGSCLLATVNLTITQRVAIGLAIESVLGRRQGKRRDIQRKNHPKSMSLPLISAEVSIKPGQETRTYIAELMGIGKKDRYRSAQQVFLQGIPALRKAMDNKQLSISHAGRIAQHPAYQQQALLTDFLNLHQQKQKEITS